MNIENIDRLISVISVGHETYPDFGFNMGSFQTTLEGLGPEVVDQSGRECGTVLCLGGWTIVLARGTPYSDWLRTDEYEQLLEKDRTLVWPEDFIGAEFIGIAPEECHRLFAPSRMSSWHHITADEAVAALEHLKKTGTVDWSAVL